MNQDSETNPQHAGWVRSLRLSPPSLKDNTADADRLLTTLGRELGVEWVGVDLALLRELPFRLRQWDYHVRCIFVKDAGRFHLVGVLGALEATPALGLAVDLGTSRVVARLLNLETGQVLAETSFDNPQIEIGPDVLTRIHFIDQTSSGGKKLQDIIIQALNKAIAGLCAAAGHAPENIFLTAVAGNTTMTHLFLGLDPHWIIREPYIPVVNTPTGICAGELGLKAGPHARVIVFPNVGSYFGGDLIAGILYTDMHHSKDTVILVDVGTNAEVVLGNSEWLVACAGAAGPALEGGVTKMGMMAGPGVIDEVGIDRATRTFQLHTIDDLPPRGICGSGLIDLAAQLFLAGIVDIRGKLKAPGEHACIVEIDGLRHLVLASAEATALGKPLLISQADLDSLVRAKAAMYTILETITAFVGLSFSDLAKFYVAGTFGAFIRPASAVAIGMLPDLPLSTYQALGNTSLEGAALVLTQAQRLDEIRHIRNRITYMELNVNQDLMNRFSAARFFPHTDARRFPSVAVWD